MSADDHDVAAVHSAPGRELGHDFLLRAVPDPLQGVGVNPTLIDPIFEEIDCQPFDAGSQVLGPRLRLVVADHSSATTACVAQWDHPPDLPSPELALVGARVDFHALDDPAEPLAYAVSLSLASTWITDEVQLLRGCQIRVDERLEDFGTINRVPRLRGRAFAGVNFPERVLIVALEDPVVDSIAASSVRLVITVLGHSAMVTEGPLILDCDVAWLYGMPEPAEITVPAAIAPLVVTAPTGATTGEWRARLKRQRLGLDGVEWAVLDGPFGAGEFAVRVRVDDRDRGTALIRLLEGLRLPAATPSVDLAVVDESWKSARRSFVAYLDGVRTFESESPSELLEELVGQFDRWVLDQTVDPVHIHASCVLTGDGRGLVMTGQSGAGKSSLAAAAVEEGLRYVTDEMVSVSASTRLQGLCRPLTLKRGSWDIFPDLHDGRGVAWGDPVTVRLTPPGDLRGGIGSGPFSPAAIVRCARSETAVDARLTPLSPANTLALLIDNALDVDRNPTALQLLAAVAASAPGYEARYHEARQMVPLLLDATVATSSPCSWSVVPAVEGRSGRLAGSRPRRAASVESVVLDDEVVAIHRPSAAVVVLGGSAGRCWLALDGTVTRGELVRRLARDYAVEERGLAARLQVSIDELVELGLVDT